MPDFDEADIRILRLLQHDGGMPIAEISERAGLSQSPCYRRIALLQEQGVIGGKKVVLDRRKLGFNSLVIVRIKLRSHSAENLDQFRAAVKAIPEIQVALLVLGDFDFYLRVVVQDIDHYQQLLQGKLVSLPGVREMQSSMILEVIKDTSELPI